MYKIITASSDTYITNKYINNFRVKDANMGSAGTIDIFKLYNETYSPDNDPVELSRGFVKFDLGEIENIHNNKCNITHPSFNVVLKLFDVYGGQTTPAGFTISVHPLSKSFDEGIGRDVVKYKDIGVCNYLTASIVSGVDNKWNLPGANKSGSLNDENIDIIAAGNLSDGNGQVQIYKDFTFQTGYEDLEIDITTIISGTIAGQIPDNGFRIAITGSEEANTNTYFVKRFASRNSTNPLLRPRLIVKYDDSIQDYHSEMNYNTSGSLFLNNSVNGQHKNIMSASTASPGTLDEVSGTNCILLKIFTGSYSKYITGSSYQLGNVTYPGIYSASFMVNMYDTNIFNHAQATGSIEFTTVWTDFSENVVYKSGSFTIDNDTITSFNNENDSLVVSITSFRTQYNKDSTSRFRVYVSNVNKVVHYVKTPKEKPSETYYNMRYSIVDVDSGETIIPFSKNDSSTLLSVDSKGMYFDLDMKSLPEKRLYKIHFLLNNKGEERVFKDVASKFRVV